MAAEAVEVVAAEVEAKEVEAANPKVMAVYQCMEVVAMCRPPRHA